MEGPSWHVDAIGSQEEKQLLQWNPVSHTFCKKEIETLYKIFLCKSKDAALDLPAGKN